MILPRRAALSLVLMAGFVLGLWFLRAHSPQQFSLYPQCAFHKVTGLNCPGCGGTRCMHALLHGRFVEALRDNVLIIFFLPILAFVFARYSWFWVRGLPQPPRPSMKPWVVYTIVALVIGFAVLRNLPWAPFRYLAPG